MVLLSSFMHMAQTVVSDFRTWILLIWFWNIESIKRWFLPSENEKQRSLPYAFPSSFKNLSSLNFSGSGNTSGSMLTLQMFGTTCKYLTFKTKMFFFTPEFLFLVPFRQFLRFYRQIFSSCSFFIVVIPSMIVCWNVMTWRHDMTSKCDVKTWNDIITSEAPSSISSSISSRPRIWPTCHWLLRPKKNMETKKSYL